MIQQLGSSPDNVIIDGRNSQVQDFGGNDIYTLPTFLNKSVTITDNNASTINLPAGLNVTSAQFASNGLSLTLNGTADITFLGAPQTFTFVFGGDPLVQTGGTSLNFNQLATAFGTTVPTTAGTINKATIVGKINPDGTVGTGGTFKIRDLTGLTEVTAVNGVAEAFVLTFDSKNGTTAISDDAQVTIIGFNPQEDILRFDDLSATPVSRANFLNLALIAVNPFTDSTNISFIDPDPNKLPEAARVTIVGIQDATLGGTNPFFEVV